MLWTYYKRCPLESVRSQLEARVVREVRVSLAKSRIRRVYAMLDMAAMEWPGYAITVELSHAAAWVLSVNRRWTHATRHRSH